jgi:bla regulator protein blaR1
MTILLESAIRVTLIAAVIGLVLVAMRIKTSSLLHAVWASVVVLMMLLPAWLAWGPKAPIPVLPSQATTAIAPFDLVPPPSPAGLPQPSTSPVREDREYSLREYAIPGIYFSGLFVLLLRLAIGTIRASRLTSASCVVPVTVGLLHPRIILPECSREWPRAQLDAVLAHESEHIRRRDPFFQWLALLNRVVFWFHPLAWWLERRLSGLAEEACDAAVLARGYDAREYSEYLLDLARSVQRAGKRINAVGMAMPGIGLKHRIRQILSGVPIPKISRPRMACTVAVCAGAAAILAAGTLVRAQSSKGQSNVQFEVASIRPSNPNSGGGPPGGKSKQGGGGLLQGLDHQRLNLRSTTLGLMVQAFRLKSCRPGGFRGCVMVSGGPDWIQNDPYDLQAKLPDNVPSYTMAQLRDGEAPEISMMLQSLLADRFDLKYHRETRQLPVYVLTQVRKSPKLGPAKREMRQQKDGSMAIDRSLIWTFPRGANGEINFNQSTIQMIVRSRTIQELTDTLSGAMDRPVLNRTGLIGDFDISLQYDRDIDPDIDDFGATFGPSMMKAFERQLGLKFEATKGPVDILVIDHIERPSDN